MGHKSIFYVVIAIVFSISPALSEEYYSRSAAYDYAKTWWQSCNHICGNYQACTPWSYWGSECCGYPSHTGDCANFISQCLVAGNHPYLNDTKPDPPCRGYPCEKEEIGAKNLGDCLVQKDWERVCGKLLPPPDNIKVGDVLIYHTSSCSDYSAHAAIVTHASGSDVRIACHSANQWNKPYTYLASSKPYYEWLHYPDDETGYTPALTQRGLIVFAGLFILSLIFILKRRRAEFPSGA